jgi:hypothetical protein
LPALAAMSGAASMPHYAQWRPLVCPIRFRPGGDTLGITFRRNLRLAEQAAAALRVEQPATLRQLFYKLVSTGAIANSHREYKRLGRLMTRLREGGVVPRRWLVDHVRATIKPSSWTGLGDFGEMIRRTYRRDFWGSMPCVVEVVVEKDAVAATVQPITHEFDVALRVCRGYSSVSFAGEIADEWTAHDKPVIAFYCGDHDPSGLDIERDLIERLERYSGRQCVRSGEPDRRSFLWTRLGVLPGDFDAFGLIRLNVKRSDRRAAAFLAEHSGSCAEVDALPPTELRRRVRDAILARIEPQRWASLQAVERIERASLDDFVRGWSPVNLGSVLE